MKPSSLFKCLLTGTFLSLCASSAEAQMVGNNVFLKGQYVEVGIGSLGYYGSDSAAPAGYHPHLGTTLGFVSDPWQDGWTTGTPAYMGDYFVPGTPFEGWALQIGTSRCNAYNGVSGVGTFNCTGTAGTATGATTGYAAVDSYVVGTWEGMIDSVAVKQETVLDTSSLFFAVRVTLTNTSSTALNDIYYIRTLDPDNDETWPGGSFTTNNTIDYQLPNPTNVTVVSATGLTDTMTKLSLGTTDSNAKCLIYDSWPLASATDLASLYNGTFMPAYYSMGTTHSGDEAIGLVIKVPHLAALDSAVDSVARTTMHPANSATFTYFYAFSGAGMRQAIKATAYPLPDTTGDTTHSVSIKNVNNGPAVKVYPNPAKSNIKIEGLNTTDHLVLYDMMGRAIQQQWIVTGAGVNTFPVSDLAPGAYILVVTDAHGNIRSRVAVRKM